MGGSRGGVLGADAPRFEASVTKSKIYKTSETQWIERGK